MATIKLPDKKEDLVAALEQARGAAWPERNRYLVDAQIAHHYLRGCRRFLVTDLAGGRVQVGYETSKGEFKFRYEDIRNKYRIELGRFSRMNLSPAVSRKNWGLSAMRKASIGQVVLDHGVSRVDLQKRKMEFFECLLTYGMSAVGHWGAMSEEGEVRSEIEIIPPWELLPLPAKYMSEQARTGVMRYRKVPLAWLKEKSKKGGMEGGLSLPQGDGARAKMQVEELPYGASPEVSSSDGSPYMTDPTAGTGGKDTMEDYAPLLEVWIDGPLHTLKRYIVMVGGHIAYDETYEDVPFPVGIARFIPDLGFYSYGLVSMLVTGNHQMEMMLQNLVTNVRQLDQFGTVLWPTTAGAGLSKFQGEGRPKIVPFEPDPTGAKAKPFNLTPASTGDFPGRMAAMIQGVQDKLANQGPLFSGQSVGRVDSAAGLGFTFEVAQIAIATAAHETANAWSQAYRSLLAYAKARLKGDAVLSITNVDDNVAGVVIQPDGSVSLDNNPLPEYWEVEVDIKDRKPHSREQRVRELIEMRQLEEIDPLEFQLLNYQEGLELPVGGKKEFEGFRKATYQNILLFNDGKTPGEIDTNLLFDDPEIHLRAVEAFTSRVEMLFASEEVRQAFEQLTMTLRQRLGMFPEQMPMMPEALGGPTTTPAPAGGGAPEALPMMP
jgi:hypothetical protein